MAIQTTRRQLAQEFWPDTPPATWAQGRHQPGEPRPPLPSPSSAPPPLS